MGLAERKAVHEVKENAFKEFEAKVAQVCGFSPKLEFDWATLENNPECVSFIERKRPSAYMFDRVLTALTAVCADDMGKSAIKEGLKEIKMIPAAGSLEFVGGVLTVRNCFGMNGAYDAKQIQNVLEKGL
jgi:hypothetical protein